MMPQGEYASRNLLVQTFGPELPADGARESLRGNHGACETEVARSMGS
jgi:hypothetical protein